MQDDDVAFGGDQVYYSVMDIMNNSSLTVFMPFDQRIAILHRAQLLANDLKSYREAYGLTERRTPDRDPSSKLAVNEVSKAQMAGGGAAVAVLTQVQRLPAFAQVAGSISVAPMIRAVALALFFNALDDAPPLNETAIREALRGSVAALTNDLSDLQIFSSMAMTAAEANVATEDELIDALKAAVLNKNLAIITIIITALASRFPQCREIINTLKAKILRVNAIRAKSGSTRTAGGWAVVLASDIAALRKLLSELDDLYRSLRACMSATAALNKARTLNSGSRVA